MDRETGVSACDIMGWVCSSLRGSGEGFLVVFKSANEALLAPGKIAMVTIGKAVMEHYNIDMIIMQ